MASLSGTVSTCPSMSLRRAVRLRKEYLYRKSLEGKEKEDYERKDAIKRALAGVLSFVGSVVGTLCR